MCERFGIDEKTRFLVLYFDAKMKVIEISKVLNKSSWTLRDWEARARNGEDIRVHKKVVITEEIEEKIVKMINENPKGISLRKISARLGISRDPIKSILAKLNLQLPGFCKKGKSSDTVGRMEKLGKQMDYEDRLPVLRKLSTDEPGINHNTLCRKSAMKIPNENRKKIRESIISLNPLNPWDSTSTPFDIDVKSMNGVIKGQDTHWPWAEIRKKYSETTNHFFLHGNQHELLLCEGDSFQQTKQEFSDSPTRSPGN